MEGTAKAMRQDLVRSNKEISVAGMRKRREAEDEVGGGLILWLYRLL